MSAAEQKLDSQAERIRKQLSAAEAQVEHLRNKLAVITARIAGTAPPITGLDLLWAAALPMARNRSSKIKCRQAWNRIPKEERPTVQQAIDALKIWNKSEEWKKDGNQFVPALDRWIKNRKFEELPEGSTRDVAARYRTTPKPLPLSVPGEDVTDPAEIAKLLCIRAPRMNS